MNRPDPARIEKILGTFHPKRKPAFEEIHPWRSLIEGLRDKGASYDDIAEILKQEGVQTSDTTVRKFCHKALIENKKSRRQRKLLAQTATPITTPCASSARLFKSSSRAATTVANGFWSRKPFASIAPASCRCPSSTTPISCPPIACANCACSARTFLTPTTWCSLANRHCCNLWLCPSTRKSAPASPIRWSCLASVQKPSNSSS